MNIVACMKRVPTTEAQAKIDADGKSLDPAGLQYMISFYDELAVEEAVKTKESKGGEVTVVSIGPAETSKELRECLAKGGDKAVLMLDPDWASREARSTAKLLVAKIQELGAEIVFMGRVATDRDNSAVGPMVATYLDWACVTDVVELELNEGGGVAKRESEAGVETIEFSLPAVITCDKGLNEPRYAGLKGIMGAKKKPLESKALEDAATTTTVLSLALPPARGAMIGIEPTAEGMQQLLGALRNDKKVL